MIFWTVFTMIAVVLYTPPLFKEHCTIFNIHDRTKKIYAEKILQDDKKDTIILLLIDKYVVIDKDYDVIWLKIVMRL